MWNSLFERYQVILKHPKCSFPFSFPWFILFSGTVFRTSHFPNLHVHVPDTPCTRVRNRNENPIPDSDQDFGVFFGFRRRNSEFRNGMNRNESEFRFGINRNQSEFRFRSEFRISERNHWKLFCRGFGNSLQGMWKKARFDTRFSTRFALLDRSSLGTIVVYLILWL